jgi:hypothetical protein
MPRPTGLITFGNDGSEPTNLWGRLSQAFLRPAPKSSAEPQRVDFSRMTDEEKQNRIRRVDPTERKLGIVASILAAALAFVLYLPYMVSKRSVALTTIKPKGKKCGTVVGVANVHYAAVTKTCDGIYPASHYVLPLVVVLVLAVAIYVTVLIGRRSALAFTMVMTGLGFGTFILLLPYAVGGGWVMLRAWRTQRNGSPSAKTVMTGWVPPPPRASTRRAKSATPAGRKGKDSGSATNRKPPVANKRYTPKTPPKKKATPPASSPGKGA